MEQDSAATDVRRPKARILYVTEFENFRSRTDTSPDLSLEFLMGRALDNAMLNVGLKDVARGILLRRVSIGSYL